MPSMGMLRMSGFRLLCFVTWLGLIFDQYIFSPTIWLNGRRKEQGEELSSQLACRRNMQKIVYEYPNSVYKI